LSPEEISTKLGPSFYGLSVADTTKRPYKIYFDSRNWDKPPKPSKYETVNGYRTYVINHEFGHILGHGHEKCLGPNYLAPVMLQQTLGQKGCLKNPWPRPFK